MKRNGGRNERSGMKGQSSCHERRQVSCTQCDKPQALEGVLSMRRITEKGIAAVLAFLVLLQWFGAPGCRTCRSEAIYWFLFWWLCAEDMMPRNTYDEVSDTTMMLWNTKDWNQKNKWEKFVEKLYPQWVIFKFLSGNFIEGRSPSATTLFGLLWSYHSREPKWNILKPKKSRFFCFGFSFKFWSVP